MSSSSQQTYSRRKFIVATGAVTTLAACGNGIGSSGAAKIDARVASTLEFMYQKYPGTADLVDKASGMLVMPLITKAGFGIGGSYGRGALQIAGSNVDYYSATTGTFGFQIGAQQYAHVLFFMTQNALADFRASRGWAAGGDIEYAFKDQGGNLAAETTTALSPVIAVVFGQTGLLIGASLEGTKYTRIIP